MQSKTYRIEVDNEEYTCEWQNVLQGSGPKMKLAIYKKGQLLGSKTYSHLIDQGPGVMKYVVRLILRSKTRP